MSQVITYEIQTKVKGGNWTIVAVHSDREDALDDAHKLANGRLHKTVRVVQECFEDDSSLAKTMTVFSNEHQTSKPTPVFKPKTEQEIVIRRDDRDRIRPAVKPRQNPSSDFVRSLTLLVVGVGGSALVLIGLIVVYLNFMGK